MTLSRVTVVIPARDDAPLLRDLLALVMPQAHEVGADVLVVDDASSDSTPEIARASGAGVLTLSGPVGPYLARNAGWRHTSGELLVFTDVRSRPRPGWLEALVTALDAGPEVCIAGGDVRALAGPSLASRVFAKREGLSARSSMADPFLPYLSTCNLATRRGVLEQLDGFRPQRSGGDLDLCWRAQLEGCGRVELVEGASVDWVPRDSVKALLRQVYRYGVTRPYLEAAFASAGKTAQPPPTRLRSAAYEGREFLRFLLNRPRDVRGQLVERVWDFVFWEGYRRSWGALHSSPIVDATPVERAR